MRQRNEHTIAHDCQVQGLGYWSGIPVCVRMLPASLGTGIRMVRTDLEGAPILEANVLTRQNQELRTTLSEGTACFQMVEHLMAALYALEIDNCIIEIDAEELPGLDGSAAAYVDALRSAGLVIQAAARPQLVVDRTVRVGNAASWIEVSPSPDNNAHYEYQLDYGPECPIRPQTYRTTLRVDSFCREVAPARTFVTADQAEQLREAGVAKHVTNKDLLVFDDDGPVDNLLRFKDECARHKLLDMVGDLALVGCDVIGTFVSHRGGHSLNAKLASKLLKLAETSLEIGNSRAA
ncbi:UDP-3-O-[3-hydroxymyristoyl] N-acetylglucosamine deacetylase [Roseimaritima multifibrata]|uniref:UDP-3-O-acyl-N-acetylglucosamine deacetylase n=1 Tax=Roseimaritima multifibrata TaxID=1930274 RepID=A0A517MEJ6_9BACT|nr:UDP-3-O-acyl-N-acetylglucosamine deacetylase [Roseimaritima multifibrata]QDS93314.1 UDP-3-O-[3-hydroxymyristoyl] N-acetylglucosamine deacetylase [Roseimaritima multifibrata]